MDRSYRNGCNWNYWSNWYYRTNWFYRCYRSSRFDRSYWNNRSNRC